MCYVYIFRHCCMKVNLRDWKLSRRELEYSGFDRLSAVRLSDLR